MGDIKFILGFLAGWIATTEEGRKAANAFAAEAVKLVKSAGSTKTDEDKAN